jgi:hypothetical protein
LLHLAKVNKKSRPTISDGFIFMMTA